jgi:hypothetical protein
MSAGARELVAELPGETAIPAFVDRLVAEGARIAGVTRRRRSLENLFIEVTTSEADRG